MNFKRAFGLAMLLLSCSVHAQVLNIHVDKKGKVGFADSDGNVVIKCVYESATPFNDGVAIVSKGGKSGLIDTSGKVVLPLQYKQISKWNEQLYLVNKGKIVGLADHSGKLVLPAVYSFISKPNCYNKALIAKGGKATAQDKKTYMANAKYGIIDERGNVLVQPKFKGLYEFANDGANVTTYHEGKYLLYSYHHTTDTLVTDCKYLGFSQNGLSIYNAGVMDETGNQLLKAGLYSIVMAPKGDMVRYYITKKNETVCGYHNLATNKAVKINTHKGAVKDLTFWTHGDFNGDIAPVNGSSWSFVDKSGNVVRTGYTSLKHSIEAKLWAAKNAEEKWDVFDESGNSVASLSGYEDIYLPANVGAKELFMVKKNASFGGITRNGDVVVPFEYEAASASIYDFVAVKKGGKTGALSSNGDMIIPIEYSDVTLPTMPDSKHFWVKKSDDLYYHYNTITKNLSKTGYRAAANFYNGFAHVAPAGLNIADTPVNRAQLCSPMASQKQLQEANLSESVGAFGYIVNENDIVVMASPVSTLYRDAVIGEVLKRGNRAMNPTEQKQILLEVTRTNRTYKLGTKISEEEWNY